MMPFFSLTVTKHRAWSQTAADPILAFAGSDCQNAPASRAVGICKHPFHRMPPTSRKHSRMLTSAPPQPKIDMSTINLILAPCRALPLIGRRPFAVMLSRRSQLNDSDDRGDMMLWYRQAAPSALLCAIAVLFCTTGAPRPAAAQQVRKVSFAAAAEQGMIDVAPAGLGLSSGFSIVMAIRSRVGDRLEIAFGPLILKNNCGDEQSMMALRIAGEYDEKIGQDILKEAAFHAKTEEDRLDQKLGMSHHWLKADVIRLEPYQPKLYLFLAFCLEFAKHNPSAKCTFDRIGHWSAETDKLFACLERNPTAPRASLPIVVQLATWATTDDVTLEGVAKKMLVVPDSRAGACDLLDACGIPPGGKKLCLPPAVIATATPPPPPAEIDEKCHDQPALVPGLVRRAPPHHVKAAQASPAATPHPTRISLAAGAPPYERKKPSYVVHAKPRKLCDDKG
jgi:hypothetical protein